MTRWQPTPLWAGGIFFLFAFFPFPLFARYKKHSTFITKAATRRVRLTTLGTRRVQLGAAGVAKFRASGVVVLARGAEHICLTFAIFAISL